MIRAWAWCSHRRLALVLSAALALAVVGAARPGASETLEEALVVAYSNNPTLLAARAELRSTDEGVSNALSGWRPTVQFEGSAGVSDTTSDISGSTTEATTTPRSFSLSVTEPLYRGGRTVAETRQAENLVLAQRAQLTVIEQGILLDGVTAYMNVLRDRSEVELNRNNERVLRRQLDAARDRFEVGEVTRTDVAQAEARLAQAKADRIRAEGALISSRATYRQVIGDLPGTLGWPEPATGTPESERAALAFANKRNPAVISADYTERAARDGVDVAASSLLPRLSLRGEYDRDYEPSSVVDETETASLLATVTVPFYQAGAEHSDVRRSKQLVGQRRFEMEESRRAVLEEVTRAWESLITAQAQITAFEAQVRAAEIALEGVEQEALVGLRTTLDVLDAEQEMFGAQVNLVRARRDEIVSSYWVKSTTGDLTAGRLGLPVEVYDVEAYYRVIRDKLFGLSIKLE